VNKRDVCQSTRAQNSNSKPSTATTTYSNLQSHCRLPQQISIHHQMSPTHTETQPSFSFHLYTRFCFHFVITINKLLTPAHTNSLTLHCCTSTCLTVFTSPAEPLHRAALSGQLASLKTLEVCARLQLVAEGRIVVALVPT